MYVFSILIPFTKSFQGNRPPSLEKDAGIPEAKAQPTTKRMDCGEV